MMDTQDDLSLCWANVSEDTLSRVAAQMKDQNHI